HPEDRELSHRVRLERHARERVHPPRAEARRVQRRLAGQDGRRRPAVNPTRDYSGTNSLGFSEPPPKKNFSISVSRNFLASGSMGVSRYSLMSIVWCASHFCHASFDTLA